MTRRLPVTERPLTRADCRLPDGALAIRPCPWLGCRHHTIDVREHPIGRIDIGALSLAPDAKPADVDAFVDAAADWVATRRAPSCALDVADIDEGTLADVGEVIGITRERVRQIETHAKRHLTRAARRRGVR